MSLEKIVPGFKEQAKGSVMAEISKVLVEPVGENRREELLEQAQKAEEQFRKGKKYAYLDGVKGAGGKPFSVRPDIFSDLLFRDMVAAQAGEGIPLSQQGCPLVLWALEGEINEKTELAKGVVSVQMFEAGVRGVSRKTLNQKITPWNILALAAKGIEFKYGPEDRRFTAKEAFLGSTALNVLTEIAEDLHYEPILGFLRDERERAEAEAKNEKSRPQAGEKKDGPHEEPEAVVKGDQPQAEADAPVKEEQKGGPSAEVVETALGKPELEQVVKWVRIFCGKQPGTFLNDEDVPRARQAVVTLLASYDEGEGPEVWNDLRVAALAPWGTKVLEEAAAKRESLLRGHHGCLDGPVAGEFLPLLLKKQLGLVLSDKAAEACGKMPAVLPNKAMAYLGPAIEEIAFGLSPEEKGKLAKHVATLFGEERCHNLGYSDHGMKAEELMTSHMAAGRREKTK